jgi:hypothetical protein
MIDQLLTRLAITLATLLAALLIVVAALGFLFGAAYLALAEIVSPARAALATGVAALVFAGLIVMGGRLLSRRSAGDARRRAHGDAEEDAVNAEKIAGEMGALLATQMASLVRGHKRSTLTVSLLAGFAVGASPRLRKHLLDIVLPR